MQQVASASFASEASTSKSTATGSSMATETDFDKRSTSALKAWREKHISWTGNFYVMILSHILGVALKNQLFEYTAIVLAPDVASLGNGLLFSGNVVVSFFAGTIVSQLGCRGSQVLGHVLMLGFVALLSVCVFAGSGSSLQWPLYLTGVAIASLAQPVENTMMGPLVELTSQVLAANLKDQDQDADVAMRSLRSGLLVTFTVCVSCTHIVVNGLTGCLLQVLQRTRGKEFAITAMFPALSAFIFFALAMMVFTREPPQAECGGGRKSLGQEVRNMCRLWQDPRIWLLGFAPLSLGLANAWKLVALSREANKHLGAHAVAYLLLVQSLGQIVLPKLIGCLLPRTGAGLWFGIGALNYMLMPMLYWSATSLTQGWGIMAWYVMMGIAFSIYDVVARTVVLEHFPKEQAGYAFATMNVQMFATQALMFFLGRQKSPSELAALLLVVSSCMLPGYLLAECLRKRRSAEQSGEQATQP